MALSNYKIALTGFSDIEKESLYSLIAELGGVAVRGLNSNVTHLLAKKAIPTEKYAVRIFLLDRLQYSVI